MSVGQKCNSMYTCLVTVCLQGNVEKKRNGTLTWVSNHLVCSVCGMNRGCVDNDTVKSENLIKWHDVWMFYIPCMSQPPLSKACICPAPSLNLGRPVSTCDPRCIPQLTHSGFSNFMSYNARAILKQWKTAGRNKERRPAQPAWTDLTRSGVSPKVSFRFSRLG